jgi:hypothetical protein
MYLPSRSFASTSAGFWRLVALNVAGAFLSCLSRSVTMTEADILSRLPKLPEGVKATATDTGSLIAIGLSRGEITRRITIPARLWKKAPELEARCAAEFLLQRLDEPFRERPGDGSLLR